jgi:EAL domain-containing protein (putative c-di-GMP-specific phosphodiesterase class I)/multidrug resistance efflux pump
MAQDNHVINESRTVQLITHKHNSTWRGQPQELFEFGEFELWYQPVYLIDTGNVWHYEVLVRWRDENRNLYLPDEFMTAISKAGLLARLDTLVVRKAIDCLIKNPHIILSVNISHDTVQDFTLLEDLQTWFQDSGVEAKRLSFEFLEFEVAQDFEAAQIFITGLKSLGCQVILDDFASRELTIVQYQQDSVEAIHSFISSLKKMGCQTILDDLAHRELTLSQYQELSFDAIKLNEQFLHCLKIGSRNQNLARAILDFCQSQSLVTAKFVTDKLTLQLAQEVGVDTIQGNYLQPAQAYPEPKHLDLISNNRTKSIIAVNVQPPPLAKSINDKPAVALLPPSSDKLGKDPIWKRLLVGAGFVGVGVTVAILGIISLEHRISNLVIENGIINGRLLQLRAPINGTIKTFYPRPGVLVKPQQILARIGVSQDVEQSLLQMQGEVKSKTDQLATAEKNLSFLQSLLQRQEGEFAQLWKTEVAVDGKQVTQKQVGLDIALAKAQAARLDYNRFRDLSAQGAISQQKTDQAKAIWEVAEAEVRQAREAIASAEVELNASQKKIALNTYSSQGNSFAQQANQIRQQIQNQALAIRTLQTEVKIAQGRLHQVKSLYSDRQDLEIKAPLAAVVYSTEREQGNINQSEEILSLLDCNDIWVEVVVSSEDATHINSNQPVLVELAGTSQPITGKISLIQAISSQGDNERSKKLQSQAIMPSIPTNLIGKPLSRITIKIPPPKNHTQHQKFCGLGQPARLTFATKSEAVSQHLHDWKSQLLQIVNPKSTVIPSSRR